MHKVDNQYCRMKCYQLTLPFPNTWKWVLLSMYFTLTRGLGNPSPYPSARPITA